MIKFPDNDLTKKLAAIKPKDPDDPASCAEASREHDLALVAAWKSLAGPAKEALDILLANIEGQSMNNLTNPQLTPEARAFTCGRICCVYELQSGIDKFMTFDPNKEDYSTPTEFGDPDAAEGLGGEDVPY
jgi:hypothetical protein